MKKAFLQLHLAVFLAGFTAILGKLITLDAGMLVWWRLLLTVITLGVLLYFRKELQVISFKNAMRIFAVGFLVAMHWVGFYASVKYSNVSVSLTCFSSIGFFTAFFEPLILKRRIDVMEVVLGLIAIVGIYLIFDFHPQFKTGILFGIISAFLASLFPIYNKRLLAEFSPKTVTLYEMTGGLITLSLILPFYLARFPSVHYVPAPLDWLWLVILAWICTVFSFELQLNALRKISPFTANLTYNLEPVYGILLAFMIFHENKYLSPGFYFGLGFILLAVLLQMVRVRSQAIKTRDQMYLHVE